MDSNYKYITQHHIDGVPHLTICHPMFSAVISLFGGHLVSFIPTEKKETLWLAKQAIRDGSKAIRGGIPICWPWFGASPNWTDIDTQHGFVRNRQWLTTKILEDESEVAINLIPDDTDWPEYYQGINLALTFTFSTQVEIELTTVNNSNKELELSQAIHTYFATEDIDNTAILGLENTSYQDKLQNNKTVLQTGKVFINNETDRIYLTNQESVVLENGNNRMTIAGQGHDSIVIWNPWQQKAKDMSDFEDDGYISMICVEMANTRGLKLSSGQAYTLSQTF